MYLLQRQGWQRQAPVHKFLVQKGVEQQATPATQTQPQAKRKRPGSTRICAHAAQGFPLATRRRRTSRAHQGIEARSGGCLESNVYSPHRVRHAERPEAYEPQEASSEATLGRRCSLPRRAVRWHGRNESKADDLALVEYESHLSKL